MFKKLLSFRFHLRFVCNPLIRYKSDNMGNVKCVNQLKREVPVIVSLTSYEDRFGDLEIALYSLLNQTTLPDRIILWLSDNLNLIKLPYSITKYIKNGLEIRFVKDIGVYTKNFYALKEFKNAIVVTADDDVYYPKDWLEKLYHSYAAHPEDIQVHRAHRIRIREKTIMPYEKWKKHIRKESARFDNFLTGVGGVLYPPNCFTNEAYRDDIFLKQAPYADDIWYWVMALVANRKIRVVKNHIGHLNCTNFIRQIGLIRGKSLYAANRKGLNDKQLDNLMVYYSNVLNKIIAK